MCPRRGPSPRRKTRLNPPGPERPAHRANPFPKVTDLICRLPLSTLSHSTIVCETWRPDADWSTATRAACWVGAFQGPWARHARTPKRGPSSWSAGRSPAEPIRDPHGPVNWTGGLQRGAPPTSSHPMRCRHHPGGAGMQACFPFDRRL